MTGVTGAAIATDPLHDYGNISLDQPPLCTRPPDSAQVAQWARNPCLGGHVGPLADDTTQAKANLDPILALMMTSVTKVQEKAGHENQAVEKTGETSAILPQGTK